MRATVTSAAEVAPGLVPGGRARSLLAFASAFAIALAFALAGEAHATSVQVLSLDEMAERATVIVEATVVDVRVEHEGTRASTYTTLRVDDAIEGSARGELLIVFQPGVHPSSSTVAPYPPRADGEPQGLSLGKREVRWLMGHRAYRVGERVMFFGVRHRRAGIDVVVHLTLGYGTFDVADDGSVRELVLDVIDTRTHVTPRQRTFQSRALFRAAMRRE